MSENKFETVSSLVDDYKASDAAFDEMLKDQEMQDAWQQYQFIGDVMRDEVPEGMSDFDISAAVADDIEQEPTVLAPAKKPSVVAQVKAKVVQFAKPFGQVAIAASAAGVMVLGVQQNVAETDSTTPYQVVQTGGSAGGIAQPVSYNFQQSSQNKQQAIQEQQRRFRALLQDHRQQMKFTALTPATGNVAPSKANTEVEKPVK